MITERAVRDFLFCQALLIQKSDKQVKPDEKLPWHMRNVSEIVSALQTGQQPGGRCNYKVERFGNEQSGYKICIHNNGQPIWVLNPTLNVVNGFDALYTTIGGDPEVWVERTVRKSLVQKYKDQEDLIAHIVMGGFRSMGLNVLKCKIRFQNIAYESVWNDEMYQKAVAVVTQILGILERNKEVDPSYICKWCSWTECPCRDSKPQAESTTLGGQDFEVL